MTGLPASLPTIRVAYLVTHPIQYQAPLLRRIAEERDIDLEVFFRSDISLANVVDPGFGVAVKWDTDLLAGYHSTFLPAFGGRRRLSFWRPYSYGLFRELRRGKFDALWIHGYGYAYHLYACLIGRLLGIRVLLRDEAHSQSRVRAGLSELRARTIFAFLRWAVDRFLAIGTANAAYYRYRGVSAERVASMPYAVDNAAFSAANADRRADAKGDVLAELNITAPRSIVLFASKLQRRKRCLDLVAAFSALDLDSFSVRPLLIVVGDGEERREAEAVVERSGLRADIRFLGFRNQTELPRYYQAADIFVLPSHGEAWGLVINEAMAAGAAVIAARGIGAVPDLVIDGENGFTFDAGDIAGLTAALRAALSDTERLRKFGEASLRRIADWDFERDIAGLRRALGLDARTGYAREKQVGVSGLGRENV